ncbi:MAG TPA: hypothetical protein V6C81_22670 [Planktothrix sp.]|jgi:hypothetical protein
MSEKTKRQRVSRSETAELLLNSDIRLKRQTEYDDGTIEPHDSMFHSDSIFYRKIRKRFDLNQPGDWATRVFTWNGKEWRDAESDLHWIYDE